jgi:hypothetical protein
LLKEIIPKYVTTEVSDIYPAERSTMMPIQVEKKKFLYIEKYGLKILLALMDAKLRWKAHVKKKREELRLKYK